ncbi:4-hydroxythreonine-4-phosphate dehydrogenase PdxA [Marinicella sp. W31]|uniref:4-hydroxythreonine-4-phosphate dehydrogenase PdxA n=1 Tax=Marinicella sp. W31 TaxID=3023713 RepID=UPI0037579618
MLAITQGEPAGIGPELIAQLHQEGLLIHCEVIGDQDLIIQACRDRNIDPDGFRIKHIPLAANNQIGRLNTANAQQVLDTIRVAAEGCLNGDYAAMVTAPIHKGIINDAGIAFSGHTEYLAEISQTEHVVMMLLNQHMRVALATTHIPLKDVAAHITTDTLTTVLNILHQDMKSKFGISQPHIAVCGLNPHAGEDGHLGMEEIEIIEPVIQTLSDQGMSLSGPIPADSLFSPEKLKSIDAVLAMYHDQGLTPLKYAGFGESVNITLGLPFIRTSVDHGTALDIAGQGLADSGSFKAAIQLAQDCIDAC